MHKNIGLLIALIGSALTALSLTGSTNNPANFNKKSRLSRSEETQEYFESGNKRYAAGNYLAARQDFLRAAILASQAGLPADAAKNFNNAGGSALARQDFRDARADFFKAKESAMSAGQSEFLAVALNNLANLYVRMGDPEAAVQVASEGLTSKYLRAAPKTRSKLRLPLAVALARLHRFDEARPIYGRAVAELEEQDDLEDTAWVLASLGIDALEANSLDEADSALTEALRLVRTHELRESARVLWGLARLRSRQGDIRSASALFDAAIAAPQRALPRWLLYVDRGEFRLGQQDLCGALADFRKAALLASEMRADIAPADQDRVAMESVLSRIAAGLVESGNRLAQETSDKTVLRETFDAAEQDRLWSLRALVPTVADWRTRLPARYWDLLAQYQTAEGALIAGLDARPPKAVAQRASLLSLQLRQMEEAAAGDADGPERLVHPGEQVSALAHVRDVLDEDSVLLSFHLTETSGWLWAIDRHGVDVYKVPALERIKSETETFSRALQAGKSAVAIEAGSRIYKDLFGSVPASWLSHKRWLLELDGPLFDLPFAALPVANGAGRPVFLIERAALQVIPGALLLQRRAPANNGEFLGVGDGIYNLADNRYVGKGVQPNLALPRLSGAAEELRECSRLWGPARTHLLMGADASVGKVEAALRSNPSVIHFAAHIVGGPGEHASGMIALSLDPSGAVELLGPREIVAHRVTAALVVMNGCHSSEGDTLPSAGLMGLTRAWIGAGAGAVLATRWDVPDDAARTFIASFYRALKANPERGPAYALQRSQMELLRGDGNEQSLLGAYFLLGRA